MSAERIRSLEKAIETLRSCALTERGQWALDVIDREAREAFAVLKQQVADEYWARRLMEMGDSSYVLRTADGLECFVRDSGAPERMLFQIERLCESKLPPDEIPQDIQTRDMNVERRIYEFRRWRAGPIGRRVPVYQEKAP